MSKFNVGQKVRVLPYMESLAGFDDQLIKPPGSIIEVEEVDHRGIYAEGAEGMGRVYYFDYEVEEV